MDVPVIITVRSKQLKKCVGSLIFEQNEGRNLQEPVINSNEDRVKVYKYKRQILKNGKISAKLGERDRPVEIVLNLPKNENVKEGVTAGTSYGSDVPKHARSADGRYSTDGGRTNTGNRSKKCLICKRDCSGAGTKVPGQVQPQKNCTTYGPNSLESVIPTNFRCGNTEKGYGRSRDCLLCGRNIDRVKEEKAREILQTSSVIASVERPFEEDPLITETLDKEDLNLPWKGSNRDMFHNTWVTPDEDGHQPLTKETENEEEFSLSWENSERALFHDHGVFLNQEDPHNTAFQPLTKETVAEEITSSLSSENSDRTLLHEDLLTRDQDGRHDTSIQPLAKEKIKEEPGLSCETSDRAVLHVKGLTFTWLPQRNHKMDQLRENMKDVIQTTSKQEVREAPENSPSELIQESSSLDLSNRAIFRFLEEEEILIVEEEWPEKKEGLKSKLKSLFRRIRRRKAPLFDSK